MHELIFGLSNIVIYFVVAVVVLLSLRLLVNIYDELFRKMLHFVLLGSLVIWTISFQTWGIEVCTTLGFVVIVYPILIFFEKFPQFSKFITERAKGEIKNSLVVVFVMFSIVIVVCEGIFNDKYLTIAAIAAWGIGDAMAALIGKRFGKHKLVGKKSVEGTLAMFVTSVLSVYIVLYLRGGTNPILLLMIALITGGVSSLCELYTKNGMDTITCPLASMTVMLSLLSLLGGL